MKKILTLAAFDTSFANTHMMYESAELYIAQDGESCFEFVTHTIKQASGKYIVFFRGDFSLADVHSLITLCTKANEDILIFNGGHAFKTTLLKSVALNSGIDYVGMDVCCSLAAKTVTKTKITPFVIKKVKPSYSPSLKDNLIFSAAEFKKVKSKLPKEIYTFVFERLKDELADFYAATILEIKAKKVAVDELTAFDEKIRQDLVLYLAFEKHFTYKYLPLGELRNKKFKLGFFAANKLKNLVR